VNAVLLLPSLTLGFLALVGQAHDEFLFNSSWPKVEGSGLAICQPFCHKETSLNVRSGRRFGREGAR